MLQRYFFELQFNGKNFHGWQVQPNEISVQEVIENCLTQLNSKVKVNVVGCGRTDSGVHANHFVLHTDIPSIEDVDKFLYKLNCMLPDAISVLSIRPVENDLHARFNAKSRTYRYFIHLTKDPFKNETSTRFTSDLDILAMNEAAEILIGTQDFTSFSKLHTDVKTNICTVSKANWVKSTDDTIYFEIQANRFLRNMVRAIVGTLLDVGRGKTSLDNFKEILEAQDRQSASISAPAHGLFLWRVEY